MNRRVAGRLRVLFGLCLAGLLVFLALPAPIAPVSWSPPAALPDSKSLARLERAMMPVEKLGLGQLEAAEDIAVAKDGLLYASNGGLLSRIKPGDKGVVPVVRLGGQTLGLTWLDDETLIVANQPRGIFRVNVRDGAVTRLVAPTVARYPNGLAVSADGRLLFFTDSSSRHYGERWKYLLDLLEARPHGSLYVLDFATGKVKRLLKGLYYPNGIAMSPGGDYLLLNETYRYRIRRYWLRGPQAGTADFLMENLPGFPDGISRDPVTGRYWVALYTTRNPVVDALHQSPFLKAQMSKLPRSWWPTPKPVGVVMEVTESGEISRLLKDTAGIIAGISSARRVGGDLYLGTLRAGFVGRTRLTDPKL